LPPSFRDGTATVEFSEEEVASKVAKFEKHPVIGGAKVTVTQVPVYANHALALAVRRAYITSSLGSLPPLLCLSYCPPHLTQGATA
jgi:hypothetical protein